MLFRSSLPPPLNPAPSPPTPCCCSRCIPKAGELSVTVVGGHRFNLTASGLAGGDVRVLPTTFGLYVADVRYVQVGHS